VNWNFLLSSDSDDDDGLPPDPVGISRVSDALQAHTWPNMELKEKQEGQKKDSDGDDRTKQQAAEGGLDKAAATIGGGGSEAEREGEKGEEKGHGAASSSREGLETKATASLAEGKEGAKSKVGKSGGFLFFFC
jgi:hypothetical protein